MATLTTAPPCHIIARRSKARRGAAEETRVGAYAGYVGVEKRPEVKAKVAEAGQEIEWHIARRRKPIREMAEGWQRTMHRW